MKNATKEEKQAAIDLAKSRNDSEYSWVKQVLVAISTILGLIISLKDSNSQTYNEHIAFVVAILSNGLCVLVGLLFLHRETDVQHSLLGKYVKHISDSSENKSGELIEDAQKRIYEVLKAAFFVLLFLSIISLLVYAIYSDKVEKPKEKFETELFKMK